LHVVPTGSFRVLKSKDRMSQPGRELSLVLPDASWPRASLRCRSRKNCSCTWNRSDRHHAKARRVPSPSIGLALGAQRHDDQMVASISASRPWQLGPLLLVPWFLLVGALDTCFAVIRAIVSSRGRSAAFRVLVAPAALDSRRWMWQLSALPRENLGTDH